MDDCIVGKSRRLHAFILVTSDVVCGTIQRQTWVKVLWEASVQLYTEVAVLILRFVQLATGVVIVLELESCWKTCCNVLYTYIAF